MLLLWSHFISPVSFLASSGPQWTLQRSHSILWVCCEHSGTSAPAGAFTRQGLPPSIRFSTRKSAGRSTPQSLPRLALAKSSRLPFICLCSFQPFKQSPGRNHHCHRHGLFSSSPCTREQAHMVQTLSVSIILHERAVLLGGEVTAIHPHIFINCFGNRFL